MGGLLGAGTHVWCVVAAGVWTGPQFLVGPPGCGGVQGLEGVGACE